MQDTAEQQSKKRLKNKAKNAVSKTSRSMEAKNDSRKKNRGIMGNV